MDGKTDCRWAVTVVLFSNLVKEWDVKGANQVHSKLYLHSTCLGTRCLSQCCDVLSPLVTKEAHKNILSFSHTKKYLELLNRFSIGYLLLFSAGLRRIQPEEGTSVLGPWLEGTVGLSLSQKDAGSEFKKVIWSWIHIYMVLGASNMWDHCNIRVRSGIFSLNLTRI